MQPPGWERPRAGKELSGPSQVAWGKIGAWVSPEERALCTVSQKQIGTSLSRNYLKALKRERKRLGEIRQRREGQRRREGGKERENGYQRKESVMSLCILKS